MKPGARDPGNQIAFHGWNLMTGGAIFGLAFGIISPLIGSVLTAIAWFAGPEWRGLSLGRAGTLLLLLTIPFLIFGAHCLDLLERLKRQPLFLHGHWS